MLFCINDMYEHHNVTDLLFVINIRSCHAYCRHLFICSDCNDYLCPECTPTVAAVVKEDKVPDHFVCLFKNY